MLQVMGDDDPPPEVPGGLSDSRYISKWRLDWPHGGVDNSVNDEDVLNLKGKKRTAKEKPPVYTYPWTLDSDIVDSQKHLGDVEDILDKKLETHVYEDRGYRTLNSGDRAIKSWYL